MVLDAEAFRSLVAIPLRPLLLFNLYVRVLGSAELLKDVTSKDKAKLCKSCVFDDVPPGHIIVREGDVATHFAVLVQGHCEVSVRGRAVARLGPGDYWGHVSLLENRSEAVTITAVSTDQGGDGGDGGEGDEKMMSEERGCVVALFEEPVFHRVLAPLHVYLLEEAAANPLGLPSHHITQPRDLNATISSSSSAAGAGLMRRRRKVDLKLKNMTPIAALGQGNFASVTLVQESESGDVFALKSTQRARIEASKQRTNLYNERHLLESCHHPFIARLHAAFDDATSLHLLLEYVPGGELFHLIHRPGKDGLSNERVKFYSAGILLAICYLHGKDIAYRDLKAENCLIDAQGYPKLVDFGFAKVITDRSFTLCGTPEYLAPELVLGRGHTKAVDYWALGVLVYEMALGRTPFLERGASSDHATICKNILTGRVKFDQEIDPDCKVGSWLS